MSPAHKPYILYSFFDPENKIEYLIDSGEKTLIKNGKKKKITNIPFKILLLLLENAERTVWDETFFREIWNRKYPSDNVRNKLTVQITFLRKIFDDNKKTVIIRSSGDGYQFNLPVEKKEKTPIILPPPEPLDASLNASYRLPVAISGLIVAGIFIYLGLVLGECQTDCREKTIFRLFAILFYGILSGVGVLLECAYQFDRYGWPVVKMIPSIVLVNAGAMLFALAMPDYFFAQAGFQAFWVGLSVLTAGAVYTCFIARFVLPNEPVVKATFQTQPAFAAFCKNMGLYFLPLYTLFIVLIFDLAYSSTVLAANIYLLGALSVVWFVIFFFSFISTNYLSDNLVKNEGETVYKYHGLYASLLIVRGILCFLPTAGGLMWYFLHSTGATSFW